VQQELVSEVQARWTKKLRSIFKNPFPILLILKGVKKNFRFKFEFKMTSRFPLRVDPSNQISLSWQDAPKITNDCLVFHELYIGTDPVWENLIFGCYCCLRNALDRSPFLRFTLLQKRISHDFFVRMGLLLQCFQCSKNSNEQILQRRSKSITIKGSRVRQGGRPPLGIIWECRAKTESERVNPCRAFWPSEISISFPLFPKES